MSRKTFCGLVWALGSVGLLGAFCPPHDALAQPVVPGTGQKSDKVGDDFEDEKWSYNFNNPKSSHEQDDQIRYPAGGSVNGRWSEKRQARPSRRDPARADSAGWHRGEHGSPAAAARCARESPTRSAVRTCRTI